MNLNDIVTAITLTLSVMAIVISLKERKNSLRALVYDKQIEACILIYFKVSDFETELSTWNDFRLKGDHDQTDLEEVKKRRGELLDDLEKYSVILPDDLFSLVDNLLDFLSAELEAMQKDQKHIYKTAEAMDKTVDLQQNMREYFGIEKLTKANKEVI